MGLGCLLSAAFWLSPQQLEAQLSLPRAIQKPRPAHDGPILPPPVTVTQTRGDEGDATPENSAEVTHNQNRRRSPGREAPGLNSDKEEGTQAPRVPEAAQPVEARGKREPRKRAMKPSPTIAVGQASAEGPCLRKIGRAHV